MTGKQDQRGYSQSIQDEKKKKLFDTLKQIKRIKQQPNSKDSLKNFTIKVEDKKKPKSEIIKCLQNGKNQQIQQKNMSENKANRPELKISDFTSIGLEILQHDYGKQALQINKNDNQSKSNDYKNQPKSSLIKQKNLQNSMKRPLNNLVFTEQLQKELNQLQRQSLNKKKHIVSPQKCNQSTCIQISSSQEAQTVTKSNKISITRKAKVESQENQQFVKVQNGIHTSNEEICFEQSNQIKTLFSKVKLTYVHLNSELKAKLRRQKLRLDEKDLMHKISDFKVNLQSTFIRVAQTAPISIIMEKIKLQENIFIDFKNYRFFVFKGTQKDLRQTICSPIFKTNNPIKSQRFINLQRLYQWYTLAHIHSCSSNIVIVVDKITPYPFIDDFYTFKCVCKNICTEACLCLQFWVCRRKDPCSQRTLSMIDRHQKICKYSRSYKPMSNREEFILLHQQGVVGLKNNQNSCFMNTALQCLVACQPLTQYFLQNQFMKNMNLGNPFGTFGQITTRYVQFLREYFTTSKPVIDTQKFKRALCRWDNKYLDNQQEDSQQFLSQLLDWLKEDLNLNRTRPQYIVTEDIQHQGGQKKAQRSWETQLIRHNSIIEYLMAGVLKSQIQCTECSYKSQNFQNFLTLPLPVTKSKPSQRWTFQIKVTIVYENFRKKNETTTIRLDSFRYKDALRLVKSTFGLKKQSSLIGIAYQLQTGQNIRIENEQQGRQQLIKSRGNANQRSLLFFQHKRQQLNTEKFIEIKFSIKLFQNGTLVNKGCPRYLFLLKKQEYLTQEVYSKLLSYFYSMMFKGKNEINETEYLKKYLRPENVPFKIYLPYENTQIPIKSNIEFKDKTQIDVVFENQELFSCQELTKSIFVKKTNKLKQNFDNHQDSQMSIYDCLKEFESTDVMDSDNCWNCPKCKEKRKALKRISIYKAPKVLILFFKRFASTGEDFSHEMRKLQNFVSFPSTLNLSGFVQKEEVPYTSEKRPLKYKLFAVANHFSSSSSTHGQSGHYIAYVCKRGQWYYVNDQSSGSISSEDVCSRNAYMLFYMRS